MDTVTRRGAVVRYASHPPMGVTVYGRPQGVPNGNASLELTVHHPGGGRAVHRVNLWDSGDQLAHSMVHSGDHTARGAFADWADENQEHFQSIPEDYRRFVGQLIRRGHRWPPEPPVEDVQPEQPVEPTPMSRRAAVVRYGAAEDEASFHRAMENEPHERTHALVYADWLEDNGRPALAHLIRLHTADHEDHIEHTRQRHAERGGEHGIVPDYTVEDGTKEQGPFVPPTVAYMPPYRDYSEPPDRPETRAVIDFAAADPRYGKDSIAVSQRAVHNPKVGFRWTKWLPREESTPLLQGLQDEGVPLGGVDVPLHASEERYGELTRRVLNREHSTPPTEPTPMSRRSVMVRRYASVEAKRLVSEIPNTKSSWGESHPQLKSVPHFAGTQLAAVLGELKQGNGYGDQDLNWLTDAALSGKHTLPAVGDVFTAIRDRLLSVGKGNPRAKQLAESYNWHRVSEGVNRDKVVSDYIKAASKSGKYAGSGEEHRRFHNLYGIGAESRLNPADRRAHLDRIGDWLEHHTGRRHSDAEILGSIRRLGDTEARSEEIRTGTVNKQPYGPTTKVNVSDVHPTRAWDNVDRNKVARPVGELHPGQYRRMGHVTRYGVAFGGPLGDVPRQIGKEIGKVARQVFGGPPKGPTLNGIRYRSHPNGKYSHQDHLAAQAEHTGTMHALSALGLLPPRREGESRTEYDRRAQGVKEYFLARARAHVHANPDDPLSSHYLRVADAMRVPKDDELLSIGTPSSGRTYGLDPLPVSPMELSSGIGPLLRKIAEQVGLKPKRALRDFSEEPRARPLPPEPTHDGDTGEVDLADPEHHADLLEAHDGNIHDWVVNFLHNLDVEQQKSAPTTTDRPAFGSESPTDPTPSPTTAGDTSDHGNDFALPDIEGESPMVSQVERSRPRDPNLNSIYQTIADHDEHGFASGKTAKQVLMEDHNLTPQEASKHLGNYRRRTTKPTPTPEKVTSRVWPSVKPQNRLSRSEAVRRYAAYRAPAGGMIARGSVYKGGEMVPSMESAFMNPVKKFEGESDGGSDSGFGGVAPETVETPREGTYGRPAKVRRRAFDPGKIAALRAKFAKPLVVSYRRRSTVTRYGADYTHHDFVNRILDDPSEVTASAAYSDWLRDNGHDEMADVIGQHVENGRGARQVSYHPDGRLNPVIEPGSFAVFVGGSGNDRYITLDHRPVSAPNNLLSWRSNVLPREEAGRIAGGLMSKGVTAPNATRREFGNKPTTPPPHHLSRYRVRYGADHATVDALLHQLSQPEHNEHRWGLDNPVNGYRGITADALDDVERGDEAELLRRPNTHVMVHGGRVVPARFTENHLFRATGELADHIYANDSGAFDGWGTTFHGDGDPVNEHDHADDYEPLGPNEHRFWEGEYDTFGHWKHHISDVGQGIADLVDRNVEADGDWQDQDENPERWQEYDQLLNNVRTAPYEEPIPHSPQRTTAHGGSEQMSRTKVRRHNLSSPT